MSISKVASPFIATAFAVTGGAAFSQDVSCKTVGSDWTWFSDHVVASITYVIVGAAQREFEAGTGPFFRGKPWGTKQTASGAIRMTAYGAGALHIRQHDGGAPFKVCATSSAIDPITIIKTEF